MPDVGLVFACSGCCCGHPERGGPKPAPRVLKAAARRAYRGSHVTGSVRLSFTDCLGPCSEANVVFLYMHGRPLWFRRMNSPELFGELLTYLHDTLHDDNAALPENLAVRSFSWAGGGVGPEPPVEDLP
jgi:cobaltochelatase CobN